MPGARTSRAGSAGSYVKSVETVKMNVLPGTAAALGGPARCARVRSTRRGHNFRRFFRIFGLVPGARAVDVASASS